MSSPTSLRFLIIMYQEKKLKKKKKKKFIIPVKIELENIIFKISLVIFKPC